MERWRGSRAQTTLDEAMNSPKVQGTGPLFDFHRSLLGTLADSHARRNHPVTLCKLSGEINSLPSGVVASRVAAHERLACVDSHGFGHRREWLPIDEKPHSARKLIPDRTARRWETASLKDDACITSRLPRSERIKLLKEYNTGQTQERIQNLKDYDASRKHLEDTPGICISSRRAEREHHIRVQASLGAYNFEAADKPPGKISASSRALRVTAALQHDYCNEEIDDTVSKTLENNHVDVANSVRCPLEEKNQEQLCRVTAPKDYDRNIVSEREEFPRLSPISKQKRALRCRMMPREEIPSIAGVQGLLGEFTSALEAMSNSTAEVSLEKAELFVKLSGFLQSRAYVLRPEDALRALRLIARSVDLLDIRERRTQYVVAVYETDSALAKACLSVREAMEQVLAAVVGRITAAEAPYLAEAMFSMAETHAGRQEFLDAMLAHMSWLLASKPRTFAPQLIARIMWAVGKMQVERGAGDTKLRVLATDGNKRALDALQARLMQVLDTFLEDDIGTLALDPTGGDFLGDRELRRVLHRAGCLQVGLRPESQKFKEPMQRLVANAQARLFLPYQAEVMPFMRDYCEKLIAPRV